MSTELFKDLKGEVQRRKNNELIQSMNVMAALYRGKLPAEYSKYMPSQAFHVVPNLVKNAWDNMTADVAKKPEFRVDALDETAREEKRASLIERIAYHYFDIAEPTGNRLIKSNAWWLVGGGRSVVLVRPDYEKKEPIFSTRDPRTAFPNLRLVDGMVVQVYDIIFESEIPVKVAKELGLAPESMSETDNEWGGGKEAKVKCYEIIDDMAWTVVSEKGMMIRDEHNLGVTPGWVFQSFNPDEQGGLSLYQDQISMMVAVSIMMSMKIAGMDKALNPIYFAKGHQGTIKIGPNVLNKLSPSGDLGVINPPSMPQADRDIDQLIQFSNILNRNPEVRQGSVDNFKGAYASAKTVEELASAVDGTVADYWDILQDGYRRLLVCALKMDETLWPKEEKRITTNVKGSKQRDTYVPGRDIDGRYAVNVEYGFGLGGYQGFLQNLQANQAKVRSRKKTVESMPGVSDVDQELRQIQLEDLSDAQMANIQSQAAAGQMDMKLMANLRKLVEKGMTVEDAVLKLAEEAEAQAQAAAQNPGGPLPITQVPPSAEAPPEEGAPLPGLNPAAVV